MPRVMYHGRTELTQVSGICMEVVQNSQNITLESLLGSPSRGSQKVERCKNDYCTGRGGCKLPGTGYDITRARCCLECALYRVSSGISTTSIPDRAVYSGYKNSTDDSAHQNNRKLKLF